MQCSDGKAFEAYPVEEWYNFMPQIKYKCLDSEEAEQEFTRLVELVNIFRHWAVLSFLSLSLSAVKVVGTSSC